MEIIDISAPLVEDEVMYPSISPLRVEWRRRLEKGDPTSLSEFTMPVHLGTHLDAPGHVFEHGAPAGSTDLSNLIGTAEVVDVSGAPVIGRDLLAERLGGSEARIVLIKTGYRTPAESGGLFNSSYSHLDEEAARYLVEKGVRTLGVDTPNVDRYGNRTMRVHKRLLGAGVVILEGLMLARVEPGRYGLVALPLNLVSAEGAPVRAVLIRGVGGLGWEAPGAALEL